MKLILTDVDEILLNWRDKFSEWIDNLNEFHPTKSINKAESLDEWLGCNAKTSRRLIEEFNNNEQYFSDLQPYEEAKKYVATLHRKGYKFIAISACANNEWTYKTRWNNIQKYFPSMFIGLHCVGKIGIAADKFPYLDLYKPAIWVEDQEKHAIAGLKAGHTTFLVDYAHNRSFSHPHITRVTGWKEIYNNIESL